MFDPSISLGAILNALVLLVGFVVAFTRIGGRIDLLSLRMGTLEKSFTASSDHDKRIVTVEERLTTVQRDVSDLRRGEGFITSNRKSVDGEYK